MTSSGAVATLKDRFRGCLLGLALGDACGRYWEGVPHEWIAQQHGDTASLMRSLPDELRYTDDAQMMIGVAEALIEDGEIRVETLAKKFVDNYEPWRGYGGGARQVLEAIQQGGNWRRMAQTVFPGGSYGNGGAMRVAPVGLYFHKDLERTWNQAALSAEPTHVHPLGVEGAQLLATAVAVCVRSGGQIDRIALYDELAARATTDEFARQIERARGAVSFGDLHALGNGIEAHRSVMTAIACFALAPQSYAETIGHAILLGGDTDTIAAMAGACSGALLGAAALPATLLGRLENDGKGRDYIDTLATQLHKRQSAV